MNRNEERSLEIFEKLKDDIDVVFDVGSRTDIDYFDIKESCEYHLFEPNIEFVNALQGKVSKISKHNIKVNCFGLSDVAAKQCVYYTQTQSFEINPAVPFMSIDEGLRFDLSTLDEYVLENGIERIDFLKIDTEGLDFKVLKGAEGIINSGNVKYIQFELWVDPILFFNLLKDRYDMYFILEDLIIEHMPEPIEPFLGLPFTTKFNEETIKNIIENLFSKQMGGNVFCVNKMGKENE